MLLLGLADAAAGLLWAFYSRKLGWYLFVRGRENREVTTAVVLTEFASILALTLVLEYVVYRLVLGIVRPGM